MEKGSFSKTQDKLEPQDKQRIDEALPIGKCSLLGFVIDLASIFHTIAQKQVTGMKKCVDNPGDPQCKKNLEAAFGKQGQNYNLDKVKDTVNKMNNQDGANNMNVMKKPLDMNGVYGFTHTPKNNEDLKHSAVQLGKEFHCRQLHFFCIS